MQNNDEENSKNVTETKTNCDGDDERSVNSERESRTTFNIPWNEYHSTVRLNRSGNKLSGEWTDTVYKHFHKVFPTCSLVFRYNHVMKAGSRKQNVVYWKGKASCHNLGCVSVNFTIDDKPVFGQVVPVTAIINGQCNHSLSRKQDDDKLRKRFFKGSVRRDIANFINDTRSQPTSVFYDRLSEMNQEELNAGN